MIFLCRVCILIFLIFLPDQVFADPVPMTKELQGIWSRPDCATSEQALVISRNYVLAEAQGIPFIIRIDSWRSEPFEENNLYLYTGTKGDQAVLRKTNDGLIKMIYKAAMPTQALHTLWGSHDEKRAVEYSRCVKLFDSRPGMTQGEVNIIFALDKMVEGCKGVTPDKFPSASSCHKAIFTVLDSNSDGAMDDAELGYVYRMAGFVKMGINPCSAKAGDYPGTLPDEAKVFAKKMLIAFDGDKDGRLTLAEIAARASDHALYQDEMYAFIENARNTQAILPFMPQPDVLKTCDLNRREVGKYMGTMPLTEKPDICPACSLHHLE